MRKSNFLHLNNLAKFLGDTVDTGFKILQNSKVLDDTGVPFGKFAHYITQRIIEISDKDEAFQKAIMLTYYATFCKALLHYKMSFKIDEERLNALGKKPTQNFSVEAFDLNNFYENKIIQFYDDCYAKELDNGEGISTNEKIKIQNYIKDYLRINFIELLEDQTAKFATLNDFLASKAYLEYLKLHRKEKYRTSLKNKIQEVVLDDEEGMTLKDIYIEPFFNIYHACFDKNDLRLQKHQDEQEVRKSQESIFIKHPDLDCPDDYTVHSLMTDFFRGNDTLNIYSGDIPRVMFLLGHPGQGKTSLCKRFLYDVFGKQPLQKDVYFLRFRDVQNVKQLIANPLEVITEEINIDIKVSEEKLRESLLVLDGLDEIYIQRHMSFGEIDRLCKELIRKAERYTSLQILITSRYGYLDLEKFDREPVLITDLALFNQTQQLSWLGKYNHAHKNPEYQSWLSPETLKRLPSQNPGIQELISQPLLLHMIATLKEGLPNQATNPAQIYSKIFDQIIYRKYDRSGSLDLFKNIEPEDLRELIQEIAFEIFQTGKTYISKSALVDSQGVKEFIEKLDMDTEELEGVLKGVLISFYFQEVKYLAQDTSEQSIRSDYAIEFLHKSLQEFMIAEKLYDTVKYKFLASTQEGRKTRYTIQDTKSALTLLNQLFAHQYIAQGEGKIADFLMEIVTNDTQEAQKEQLAERLRFFLSDFLMQDFLAAYNFEHDYHPMDLSAHTFYGYWTILSHLDHNHLIEMDYESKKRFVHFLNTKPFYHLNIKDLKLDKLNFPRLGLVVSNLNGINLSGSDLDGCDFYESQLGEANLINISLWYGDLSRANLDKAKLNWSILSGSSFRSASLIGASLSGVLMVNVDLRASKLMHADLTEANFNGSNLSLADLEASNLENSNLRRVNLRGAVLRKANLKNADLQGADLTGADLRGANLEEANLHWVWVEVPDWFEWHIKMEAKNRPKGVEALFKKFQVIEEDDEKGKTRYKIVKKK